MPKASQELFITREYSGFSLDLRNSEKHLQQLPKLAQTFAAVHAQMQCIEAGDIKNPDEGRQVTHFGDRAVYASSELFADVEAFFAAVRSGELLLNGKRVSAVVINGIGGSALGPQLAQFALRGPYWNELSAEQRDGNPKLYILDNTDPAGIHDLCAVADWSTTLVITISKSGGTREPRNNMFALQAIYERAGP